MNSPKYDLSVILPSYLEEENLRLLLPRIKAECEKLTPSFEVLVLDTMTPMDGTDQACAETGVTYVNREGGNTYGDAIRTGINKAQGQSIIFMDADGSHPPSFLHELYERRQDHDIIIASRYIKGGHTENNRILVLMSMIVNFGYRFMLGLKCKDVSNSFKLYKAAHLKEITLRCQNFDVVEEILVKILRNHKDLNIKEVPFSFKQRMFGETKRNLLSFIVTYVFTLIRLRFGR